MNHTITAIKEPITQKILLNTSITGYNPYTQPTQFCGVVTEAVQQHYQTLLNAYWGLFLIGGTIIGLLIGMSVTLWYKHKTTSE